MTVMAKPIVVTVRAMEAMVGDMVMAKPTKMNKEADMARSMGAPVDRLMADMATPKEINTEAMTNSIRAMGPTAYDMAVIGMIRSGL